METPGDPTFQKALAFAADLIRIPSPPGGEGEVAGRVREEMRALGFSRIETDEVGNVLGIVHGRGEAPPVLLNSHLDVVHAGDPEGWEHPPYSGAVEDGFLHGRGAMDIKGPLALQTYAAAFLAGRAPGDVIVSGTVFEERGGWGMDHLLSSGRIEPGAVILGEATHGDIAVGHRGRGELEVVIHGVAGHASAPHRSHNPLDLVGAVLEAVRDLGERQPTDELLGPQTLVSTGVEAIPSSRNVVPDRAVVVVDWRVLPAETPGSLVDSLREGVRRRLPELPEGFGLEVRLAEEEQTTYTGTSRRRKLFTPGFLLEPGHPMVRAAARAVGRKDGEGEATVRPWTFATDGGWSCGVHGIPSVGFAPGEERYAHTNRERLDLDEARWAFGRLPELILAVQRSVSE